MSVASVSSVRTISAAMREKVTGLSERPSEDRRDRGDQDRECDYPERGLPYHGHEVPFTHPVARALESTEATRTNARQPSGPPIAQSSNYVFRGAVFQ